MGVVAAAAEMTYSVQQCLLVALLSITSFTPSLAQTSPNSTGLRIVHGFEQVLVQPLLVILHTLTYMI